MRALDPSRVPAHLLNLSLSYCFTSAPPAHRRLELPRDDCAGPFTQSVKRTLQITNNNANSVAFKVKTTAPKVSPPQRHNGRHARKLKHTSRQALLREAQLW